MSRNIYHLLCILVCFSFCTNFNINAQNSQSNKSINGQNQLSIEDRQKFDYYFYSGINAKTIGKYSAAFDYFNYCTQIDSTNATLLFELGNFYKSLQNIDKAYELYTKAVNFDPDNYFYNMTLATTLVQMQDFEKASAIYEKLIDQNPSKIELYMYLSETYRLAGDLNKSIESLNNLERTMGMNEAITMQKFKLYAALNDKKKAYAEVQKYIDKNPDEVPYYALLANLYIQDNKMKDAYNILMKGKEKDPENSLLISTLASYYELTNNTDAAEETLQSALFSNKVDSDTKIDILGQYIATLQQNKKDIYKANSIIDSLMSQYPQESKFNLLYGNLLMLEENKKEANFQFRIFAESNPTDPTGWEQLLQTTDMDSIDAMIDVCESAINYLPKEPLFYLYLSVGQYQKKDYQKALKTAREGVKVVQPKNVGLLSEFYSQSGSLHYELGNTDSAFVDYEIALKYNPQNLGVLNNYSYYLSLLRKDLDKAEKMSSTTVKQEPTNPTYLDTYGWILFEQGAYATAKIYIENALKYSAEKNETSSEILEHYGDVLFMTNEPEKALEYWLKAKESGGKSNTLDKKIETKTYIATEIESKQ